MREAESHLKNKNNYDRLKYDPTKNTLVNDTRKIQKAKNDERKS